MEARTFTNGPDPMLETPPHGDNAAFDDFQRRLRGFIADELEACWFRVHRLGVQGCFGELGRKFGWEIWDQGRPTQSAVMA